MHKITTILRAAHCRSTHHFFAIDAIAYLQTDRGQRFGEQLLRHHNQYLRGAKAPDSEFRDFKNHVLHVHDGFWGGATTAAEKWYRRLLNNIRDVDWSSAAFSAGVLSHYFTDPLMPLHTAQSEKESLVHRAMEWSVTKSYERILDRFESSENEVIFESSSEPNWIRDVVIKSAIYSNQFYDSLINRYDLARGSKDPPSGLDDTSIEILSRLFGVAIVGFAGILDRAAEEANSPIESASLTLPGILAAIKMPLHWITRRIDSAAEQQAVEEIFAEYRATGTVKKNLPAEVRVVATQRKADGIENTKLAAAKNQSATRRVLDAMARTPKTNHTNSKPSARFSKTNLSLDDDLVDAPSIGPKTAKRFAAIGVTTVKEFLSGNPATMVKQLKTRWIKNDLIIDWQDQARLVATVPGLCGYKSQLLVGIECRNQHTLSAEAIDELYPRIKEFAESNAGKRILRSSKTPTKTEVAKWIRAAQVVSAKQAA